MAGYQSGVGGNLESPNEDRSMPDVTPVPTPAKDQWWKWIVDDPKKAVRVAFFALALVGYDQWAASRVTDVKSAIGDAASKADKNAESVDDLFKVIGDVKILVGEVKAKQDVVLLQAVQKPAECKCGNLCPCGK